MELHSESNPALNTVTSYGNDYIDINEVRYQHAVCFGPEGDIKALDIRTWADITPQLLKDLAGLASASVDPMAFLDDLPPAASPDQTEVVLVGTGSTQHLLPSSVTSSLLSRGVGVEAMTTQAAARTYNILMAEGRRVIAILLPLEPQS